MVRFGALSVFEAMILEQLDTLKKRKFPGLWIYLDYYRLEMSSCNTITSHSLCEEK